MNVIFMGTPVFGAAILKALITAQYHVSAVVTQPDKISGRGRKLSISPVKQLALYNKIPVLQPSSLRGEQTLELLRSYSSDIIIVAAYGKILPPAVLALPRLGCVNVHASLLPKYRGAAPIQRAIMDGETETGVTIMRMDAGLDTGDMILQRRVPILADDNYGSLHDKLAEAGAQALLDALELLDTGRAEFTAQDDSATCYAAMLTAETGYIDWSKPGAEIVNLIRALDPEPGAYVPTHGLKLWSARVELGVECNKNALPGQIIDITKRGIVVKAGDGAVLITEVQAKGGKRMPAADYQRGHHMAAGEMLD